MTFWFIDINNNNFTNNILVESLKELYWRDIKKQISNQILNIDIGKLNSNNENMIYNEFKKLTDNYENNFDVKKLLLNEHKKIFQVVSDKFLSIDNIRTKINQNIANIETEPENLNKIKILCVTWNVGGSTLPQDYDLLELFTKNHFYYNGQTPDIVVVSIQEIVSLNAINILKSKGDKNVIKNWTKSLKNSLSTRIKFDKDLKEKARKSIIEKRLNTFRSYIQKTIKKQEEEKILKSQQTSIPLLYEKEIPFNKHTYILSLNNISLEKSLKLSKEHKENLLIDKLDSPI
jgi:hypothetical protein